MAVQRPGGKSATAFRTISEVSQDLEVPQHVLRFWETKFSQVRPLKRGGGRRYYRPEDVDLLRRIRDLLYGEGYTIKGVQRLLRDAGGKQAQSGTEATAQGARLATAPTKDGEAGRAAAGKATGAVGPLSDEQRKTLQQLLGELTELRDLLRPGDK